MFGIICVLLGVILVGFLIVKRYYAPWSLFLVGIILLAVMATISPEPLLHGAKSATKSAFFDVIQYFTNQSKSILVGLGLNIMIISGFADYLDKIGATRSMVEIAAKPLSYVKSPYLLLALAYALGQLINVFIPSAVGLGVLMMLMVYPLLISVGCSNVAAVACIITMSALDLGPASANSILTAKLASISPMEYFVDGQIPVAIVTVIAVAATHFFYQKFMDKRDLASGKLTAKDFELHSEFEVKDERKSAPKIYALFPVLPIVLLFIFSKFVYSGYRVELATAMMTCTLFSFLVDCLYTRNFKKSCENIKSFFSGMGRVFASTVSLIICAGVFADGLKATGGITTIINAAASMEGTGGMIMLLVMCGIMILASFVTGSGNAAFFAFSSLLPTAAKSVGWDILVMACPVQLVAGIARSMSPIAGVTISVAKIANVSPFAAVARTIPPMIVGTMVSIAASFVFL